MKQYKLPTICAKCGVQPGQIEYPVKIERATLRDSILFFLFALIRVLRVRTTTYTFHVRVCSQCKQKLDTIEHINKMAMRGGFISMLLSAVAFLVLPAISFAAFANLIGLVIMLFLGGALSYALIPMINRIRIGSYNGESFTFANPVFHEQFAKHNPHLARSKTR